MKITKIVLLLFAFLCTSNVWAQLNENAPLDLVSENKVIKNMEINVTTSGWIGMLIIQLDGKPLCTDYDQGILLLGENHIERTAEIDVFPGGKLTIWGYRDGMGTTNVISLTIPEDAIKPILYIDGSSSTHFPLNAYFGGY
ncbi:hypothetical protein [Bacteroides sp.]